MPLHEARRLLRAVIGAVDLDRGQFRARILELARLRQALGKERAAAPRLIGPAADADPDLSRRRLLCSHVRALYLRATATVRPPVSSTRSDGVRRKTAFGVPAAAQISSRLQQRFLDENDRLASCGRPAARRRSRSLSPRARNRRRRGRSARQSPRRPFSHRRDRRPRR